MSDNYEALISVEATREQAREWAPRIVAALAAHGLIVPEPTAECVLGSVGYPAGPACADAYELEPESEYVSPNRFWQLKTSGVEVIAEPWINAFGFPMFDDAGCPHCRARVGEELLEQLGDQADAFSNAGQVPRLACPECDQSSSLHDWDCSPHLGFVNLAVLFWNWPFFDDESWKLDIKALVEQAVARPMLKTFGHV